MPATPPLPPPFGVPEGPTMTTPELVAAFLSGARAGSSSQARIEEPVLMVLDVSLAIRIGPAVLVRDHVPPDVTPLRDQLFEALRDDGAELVEEDSVLGAAVGIEVTGLRGESWSLWARDADRARDELTRRTVGEGIGFIEAEQARQQDQEQMDAVLDRLEREL